MFLSYSVYEKNPANYWRAHKTRGEARQRILDNFYENHANEDEVDFYIYDTIDDAINSIHKSDDGEHIEYHLELIARMLIDHINKLNKLMLADDDVLANIKSIKI